MINQVGTYLVIMREREPWIGLLTLESIELCEGVPTGWLVLIEEDTAC